jgi:hypothetical protein
MSGTSFIQAVKENPWLKDKEHWCGPGNTFEMISGELKKNAARGQAHIALNYDEWQKKMQKV